MLTVRIIGVMVGMLLAALGLAGLLRAKHWAMALRQFPRNRRAAILLTAINVAWVALLLAEMGWGRFEPYKPMLWGVAPLSLWLIITYLDELLAPRMLGGLLLLIATPVLDTVRWHPSPWRLTLTLFTYAGILWAVLLVLAPYRFRQTVGKIDTGFLGQTGFYALLLLMGLLQAGLAIAQYA